MSGLLKSSDDRNAAVFYDMRVCCSKSKGDNDVYRILLATLIDTCATSRLRVLHRPLLVSPEGRLSFSLPEILIIIVSSNPQQDIILQFILYSRVSILLEHVTHSSIYSTMPFIKILFKSSNWMSL